MHDRAKLAEFELKAEEAYAAMYIARPYGVKDCYEEARSQYHQAVEEAQRAGCIDEMVRLGNRLAHVEAVYDNQFRGVGR